MPLVQIPAWLPNFPEWALIQGDVPEAENQLELRLRADPARERDLREAVSRAVSTMQLDGMDSLRSLCEAVLSAHAGNVRASTQSARSLLAACKVLKRRQLAAAPANPAKLLELPDDVLEVILRQSERPSLVALAMTCTSTATALKLEDWDNECQRWMLLLRVHTVGWVRLVDAAAPINNAPQVHREAVSRGKSIFNGQDEDGELTNGDKKRRQYRIKSANLEEDYIKMLLRFGLLEAASVESFKEVTEVNALSSTKGCRPQPAHSDTGTHGSFATQRAGDVPFSLLHAIMQGSSLRIYERGCDGPMRRLRFNACDVIVFLGDFVHAGDRYDEANTRLHAYIDSLALRREPNTTHPCEEGQEDDDPSSDYEDD